MVFIKNQNKNWIVYKTDLTIDKGQPRYLRVGIDFKTGAISAAHPFDRSEVKNMIDYNNYLGKY